MTKQIEMKENKEKRKKKKKKKLKERKMERREERSSNDRVQKRVREYHTWFSRRNDGGSCYG